jgi:hypothetical protein
MSAAARTAAALVLCACALQAPAQTQVGAAPPRDQLERKLASTSALIETSSAAKQIESSGAGDAKAQRERARELHRQASAAFQAGQLDASARLVDEASRVMFEAVRAAAPQQVTQGKQRADFDERMASTRALLDAQKRIAAEKGAGPRAADLSKRIETMMGEAAQMASNGRLTEGRAMLDQAYLAAKAAIGNLRGGDTLVRSLNFANKEEEYRYEIDRNDTHRMLIQVLLADRRGTASVDAMVDRAMAEAARLRRQAEDEATRRDHDAAVKTLEDSTRELVRAIRGAGVYIPG